MKILDKIEDFTFKKRPRRDEYFLSGIKNEYEVLKENPDGYGIKIPVYYKGYYITGISLYLQDTTKLKSLEFDKDCKIRTLDKITSRIRENFIRYNNGELNSIAIDNDEFKLMFDKGYLGIEGKIFIPNTVEKIEESFFQETINLTEVEFELRSKLTKISKSCFEGCSMLKKVVNFPNSVYKIAEYAFKDCTNLQELKLGKRVSQIFERAFMNCGFREVTIPTSVWYLGDKAFGNNEFLERVNYRSSQVIVVMSEGTMYVPYPFAGSGTESDGITVFISKNVTRIPEDLFDGFKRDDDGENDSAPPVLKNVVFEKNSKCTYIGERAFGDLSDTL